MLLRPRVIVFAIGSFILAGCSTPPPPPDMNQIAEQYVKLVLLVGQHDADFVDAYYGDPAWKPAGPAVPVPELAKRANEIQQQLGRVPLDKDMDELETLRRHYLEKQLSAVATRLAMLGGEKLSFDDEARRLYDAVPPHKTEAEFKAVLDDLEKLLPGKGPLIDQIGRG